MRIFSKISDFFTKILEIIYNNTVGLMLVFIFLLIQNLMIHTFWLYYYYFINMWVHIYNGVHQHMARTLEHSLVN